MSETALVRPYLAQYCIGNGLDLGPGGDPIKPNCISIDLGDPYTHVGDSPINLYGDARNLAWFKDGVFDFVYSSHLLEDFPTEETLAILDEWLRVIRPGGYLVLYLPDEQVYRKFCEDHRIQRNIHHQNEQLSQEWFLQCVVPSLAVSVEYVLSLGYSFAIVLRKN